MLITHVNGRIDKYVEAQCIAPLHIYQNFSPLFVLKNHAPQNCSVNTVHREIDKQNPFVARVFGGLKP